MNNIKHISITTPCTQNWAEMDVVEKGKFCQSCQKTVTDFTRLNNKQVLDLLSHSGNICGRFDQQQLKMLNSMIAVEPQVSRFSWRRSGLAAAVLSFLSLLRTEAKASNPAMIQQHDQPMFKNLIDKSDPVPTYKTLTGKVVDEKGLPLPGATVRIEGMKKAATTAEDGTFKIDVPVVSKVKLVISFIGYETLEVKIHPKRKKQNFNIQLEVNPAVLGGIAIVYSDKRPIV